MKKVLLVLTISLICTYVKAQSPYTQSKTYLYGYGAANIASLYQSSSNSSLEKFKAIWAPKIALAVRHEFAISKVGYELGVQATEKGAKFSLTDQTVRLDYAQAYADFLLYFPLTHNNTFYCGGGLFGGYAFRSKIDSSGDSHTVEFGDKWKAFDAGLQLKAMVSLNDRITVGAEYSFGFFPAYYTTDVRGIDNNGNNSVLSLTVGLRLIRFK